MKIIAALLGFLLLGSCAPSAYALTCPGYTYVLTNGQLADANQVMANFNTALNCTTLYAAPITSPAFLGTPTAPTATPGTSTTQIATTAFSAAAIAAAPYAPLASPALTGTPTAPTAGGGTNTTQIATTAFVATNFALLTDSRFSGPTQNSQSGVYAFVLTDAGNQVYHPSADTTARTWTIPANASVAFVIGTKIEVVNDCSAGALTVPITSDTLVWFPAGTTGTRTIAACGTATLTKVTSTRWILTGVGVS